MNVVEIILAVFAVVLVFWVFQTFNGLVRRKNIVAEAWSGVETQLKRRADLIPNLVETVKGYATHERVTFDELARLRSSGQPGQDLAQRAQTEQAITAAIGKIMAVSEAYPQLRASENFQRLEKDLEEIEDQIQLSRRYYNGSVRDFNTMIEQAPTNLIARGFAFKQAAFFQIENAADRDAPKVSFS
jgi:LemA protein